MTNRHRKIHKKVILRWILITLVVIICFMLSIVEGSGKPKPVLLLPVLISLCTFETDLSCGITGAIFGLMFDYSASKLMGLNGLFFLLVGVIVSLCFIYFMKKNVVNVWAATVIAAAVHGLLDFFFTYLLYGYDHCLVVFLKYTIPTFVYTSISAPFIYFIIKFIYNKCTEKQGVSVKKRDIRALK